MPKDPNIPLSRAVGRFFGHIIHAVRTPAPETEREQIKRRTRERSGQIDGKPVVLRRTTIDEIEYRDG